VTSYWGQKTRRLWPAFESQPRRCSGSTRVPLPPFQPN
jgi:hypothetical protein